jgi:transcriptional regulator with PAS, ATPase and Fis domain
MANSDTTTPTRTKTPGGTIWQAPPPIWTLQIAYHPRSIFAGRRIQLPVGTEVSLGRTSQIFADKLEDGVFQDPKVSRDHVLLRAHEQFLEARFVGKNGGKVGLRQISSSSPIHIEDGTVISIPTSNAAILIIVRRSSGQEPTSTHCDIVGTSREIGEVIRKIRMYARSPVPILLRGESGSGKDLVARALHREAGGDPSNYRPINCAELREETLQSELFGHAKGAFTGATSERKGLAEAARGGTLFLDEIAEANPTVQAMLLRFLQDKEARRMGSDEVREIEVRIVCASNANFEELIQSKQFRKDLYYRIRGAAIDIPALRERLDDLPKLAEYFLRKCAGHDHRPMDHQLLRRLLCHSWPGNIRELRSVIETAVAESQDKPVIGLSAEVEKRFEESRRIERSMSDLAGHYRAGKDLGGVHQGAPTRSLRRLVAIPSIEQVKEVLAKHNGNVVATAAELNIHRQRVYEILSNHGVDPNTFRKIS